VEALGSGKQHVPARNSVLPRLPPAKRLEAPLEVSLDVAQFAQF